MWQRACLENNRSTDELEASCRRGAASTATRARTPTIIDRIRTVCNERCTFERARSLLGSINYARIYFARRLPETFYFWKATARWAQNPKKEFCLSPAVIRQLTALQAFIQTDPAVDLSISPVSEATPDFLVTDASKAGPFSAWGAILVRGDRVEIVKGQFPLNTVDSIAVLEMRAVTLALYHWSNFMSRRVPTNLVVVTDNTASLFAMEKGYSPSIPVALELQSLYNVSNALRRVICPRFIPSALNPADNPSRGILLIDDSKLLAARRIASQPPASG